LYSLANYYNQHSIINTLNSIAIQVLASGILAKEKVSVIVNNLVKGIRVWGLMASINYKGLIITNVPQSKSSSLLQLQTHICIESGVEDVCRLLRHLVVQKEKTT
jgi:hypothetical protein